MKQHLSKKKSSKQERKKYRIKGTGTSSENNLDLILYVEPGQSHSTQEKDDHHKMDDSRTILETS